MTTQTWSLNAFMRGKAADNLLDWVWYSSKKNQEEMNRYVDEGDYQVHLEYLVDTWKNLIDEYSDKVDYDRQGTYNELQKYMGDLPKFDYEWLEDIFDRKILDTNVCLK